MKRKTSDNESRVYTYRIPFDPEDTSVVDEQMRLARMFKNKLIEIEIRRRNKRRYEENKMPAVEILNSKIDKAREERDELRSKINEDKRDGNNYHRDPQKVARIKELKAEIRDLSAEKKAAVKELYSGKKKYKGFRARQKAHNESAYAEVKLAYSEYGDMGLFWGTRLLYMKDMELARKSAKGPKHRKWDGSGRIGIQIQGRRSGFSDPGLPTEQVFGSDGKWLKIDPVDSRAWDKNTSKGERRRLRRTNVHMRIGSDGRTPILVSFPLVMHRPLPEGVIKWAWIRRHKVGTKFRWHLQMSVESPEFSETTRCEGSGVAAIDIGWREQDDEIRVGYLLDDSGNFKDIRLPSKIIAGIKYADDLRSVRDNRFDDFRSELASFMESNPTPDWLASELKFLSRWRSSKKMHRIASMWSEKRFEGDERIFELLQHWCEKDRHLHDWEAHQRTKWLTRRREWYRKLGAKLSETYHTIIWEGDRDKDGNLKPMSIAALAKKEDPENPENQSKKARSNRTRVSPGEFRDSVFLTSSNRGTFNDLVDKDRTTITCWVCLNTCLWDHIELYHTCEHCGVHWDQDKNAAANMLRIHAAPLASGEAAE